MSHRLAPRTLVVALLAIALLAAAALAIARRGDAPRFAEVCPPGYLSEAEYEARERRELRAAEGTGDRERVRAIEAERELESRDGAPDCRRAKAPEPQAELLEIQQESGRRARGGQPAPRAGAYASALRERRALARAGSVPGAGGTWEPAGRGPLISDDERFDEVNGLGLADVNGRISDFAFDADGRRLFAAVGEGGVWVADEDEGFNNWRSIGDTLPTQAVGGIDYSPAGPQGTIVIATGDNVFGGGGTFAGDGVYRSTDEGATWQKAGGVPGGVIAFKVAVDPTDPQKVYAATGAGLFRSIDAGATFENVNLPTGEGVEPGQPDCTGAPPDKEGCFLANMVTDVVVQGGPNDATSENPIGAGPGDVLAAVGWRAGAKQSPPSESYPEGYIESPNNGLYLSISGGDNFEKVDGPAAEPFNDQDRIGRVELGHADGPEQDHNYLYAIVEDAVRFRGGAPVIDADSNPSGPIPNNTVLDGIYVSDDFGRTWTQLANADQLKDPGTGSALTGFACGTQYCPGIQAWYNLFVSADPTRQSDDGVPTRMTFGLEEVWQNCDTSSPVDGTSPQVCPPEPPDLTPIASPFKVIGPYFAGRTCSFLDTGVPDCPTQAGTGQTTTHPDQHASIWIPREDGGVTYVVGHDGGVNVQSVDEGEELIADGWGRGANQGFNTLLPYDAQVSKNGTIWAGLQDNGELKIEPDGDQFQTYGGDGTFSAVDPDNADVAYEAVQFLQMNKTTDGGQSWEDVSPPEDSYMFINPFTMDPADSNHLITAGNAVHETTDGAESWETVFDLEAGEGTSNNAMSAIDVRGIGTALPSGARTQDFEFDGSAPPTLPGGGTDAPGTYDDTPFTIAPNEGNARATIEITWADETNDWDMFVYKEGQDAPVGSSAQGNTTSERVVLTRPLPGDYVIRVQNYAASGAFAGTAKFDQASAGDAAVDRSAAYVAFCGYCDALNTRPFANGLATNVKPDGSVGKPGSPENWEKFEPQGLPERYITSIQIDPSDSRTVYATLGGYSRRWLPVGVLGEIGADVSGGNVYKSTDAGRTFTDVSGDLPDIPANWTLVRNGQLVVGTNLGVFISSDTSGGGYEVLGEGLPAAPVFTLELKPKASAAEPDTLIAATQGRGVYRYEFADEGRMAPPPPTFSGGQGQGQGQGQQQTTTPPPGGGSGPRACVASRALTAASVRPAGSGLKIGFRRSVNRPVTVDVFQQSIGRTVIGERLVARFENARPSFTWNGRANRRGRTVRDGIFMVRFRLRESSGLIDARRIDRLRSGGRWSARPAHYGREGCTLLRSYKLERPVFGGTSRKSLGISYRLLDASRVTVTVRRGQKLIRRYKAATKAAGRTHRLRFAQKNRARGDYKVTVRAQRAGRSQARTLTSRKL